MMLKIYWVNEVMDISKVPEELQDYQPKAKSESSNDAYFLRFFKTENSHMYKVQLLGQPWEPKAEELFSSLLFEKSTNADQFVTVGEPKFKLKGLNAIKVWIDIITNDSGKELYQTNVTWTPAKPAKHKNAIQFPFTTFYRWQS